MNESSQPRGFAGRTSVMFLFAVIAVAAVGFLVGINDGVPREDRGLVAGSLRTGPGKRGPAVYALPTTIPAASYAEIRRLKHGPTSRWYSALETMPQPEFDLFAPGKPNEADKRKSTLTRASRRAFNGAPPVIPHAVEKTSDAACYACHSQGLRIGQLVANRPSHAFLANCMQCHAPPPPQPFAGVEAEVGNAFDGLPAPLAGQRAYPGAPPTIPHSTWMREQCLSCHGHETGWAGLQSTHPWRINCMQCHAPSAELEQAVVRREIGFVPGPEVSQE